MGLRRSFLILVFAAALSHADPIAAAKAKALGLVGNLAPDFNLPDLQDGSYNLADQRGKIIVLAFWATWCPPCRSEMPTFAKLQKELAKEGVFVVPVANDDPIKAREFLAKKKLEVLSLVDSGGAVCRQFGANALPKTFVLDRDGVVVKAVIGKASEADLRQAIQTARTHVH